DKKSDRSLARGLGDAPCLPILSKISRYTGLASSRSGYAGRDPSRGHWLRQVISGRV
ncbi:MAG: hypothetical protein AVDCRST_MAG93-8300, partial [uncultured Chloroflexia bacterium]